MAKTSFANAKKEGGVKATTSVSASKPLKKKVAEEPAQNNKAALVQQQVPPPPVESPIVVSAGTNELQAGMLVGEIQPGDIQTARLLVCNALSKDVEYGFSAGDLVLDHQVGVFRFKETAPVNIIVMLARKQYQENKDFDEGIGETVDTLREVRERGGSIQGTKDAKASWSSILTCSLLVEEPEIVFDGDGNQIGESPYFSFEYEGQRYAPVQMTFRSTGYRAARTIISTLNNHRRPFNHFVFSLEAKMEESRVGQQVRSYYTPVVKNIGFTTPEFIEWTQQIFSGAVSSNTSTTHVEEESAEE